MARSMSGTKDGAGDRTRGRFNTRRGDRWRLPLGSFRGWPAGRVVPRLRCDMPDTHQVLGAADSLHDMRGRPGDLHHRRWSRLFLDNWWGLDSSVGLLAFVALVIALCHKLLGLCAQASVVTVHQQASLRLVDRVPLGADVRATSYADLANRLHDLRQFFLWRAVHLDRGCCSRYRHRGSPAIDGCRDCSGASRPCSGRNQVGLAGTTCQGQISLLEVPNIELQHIDSALIHHILHVMDIRLWNMIFAPYSCRHCAALATDADYVMLIPPGALDGRYIKTEGIALLVCTFDMHLDTTVWVVAVHTSTALLPTGFADLLVQSPRDGGDAFTWLKCLCISEFDFWVENGTGDMYPVVVCRPLERLSWVYGPAEVLLALAVEVSRLQCDLLL